MKVTARIRPVCDEASMRWGGVLVGFAVILLLVIVFYLSHLPSLTLPPTILPHTNVKWPRTTCPIRRPSRHLILHVGITSVLLILGWGGCVHLRDWRLTVGDSVGCGGFSGSSHGGGWGLEVLYFGTG